MVHNIFTNSSIITQLSHNGIHALITNFYNGTCFISTRKSINNIWNNCHVLGIGTYNRGWVRNSNLLIHNIDDYYYEI